MVVRHPLNVRGVGSIPTRVIMKYLYYLYGLLLQIEWKICKIIKNEKLFCWLTTAGYKFPHRLKVYFYRLRDWGLR